MLLGKSNPPGRSLVEHTYDVAAAAQRLFGTHSSQTRLGERWLRFFRVPEAEWPRFHWSLLAACLFHDWGKANDDMQGVLNRASTGQLFRHEHLSVLLLGSEGVDKWVRQRRDIDWKVVLAAVGSHHLKFSHDTFAPDVSNCAVRMRLDESDFKDALVHETASRLQLPGRPVFGSQPYWGFTNDPATYDPTELRDHLKDTLYRVKSSPMLHAVRSALITADAVGSGLPRTGQQIEDWLDERFDASNVCDRSAIDEIIQKRVQDLRQRNKWGDWNEFQNECEGLPDRALLLAPCGAGKTLAAWRWILGRVSQRPVKRVLFLYPTRATATEGFKDYVSWAPETDAAPLHGTAAYDLDGMFPGGDPREKSNYDDTDPRLFAVRHWSKRVFSATVDQFFAFLSYSYGPMCLLPLLADSVIVVDEVHSFDKKMFSALLGFLDAFDVPVLCMTATMQAGRKEQLRSRVNEVYEDRKGELETIANAERYRVQRIAAADVERRVREAVANEMRVLWVVNQVTRAQDAVRRLSGLGVQVICYHSRFKLDDRVDRHRETVQAIREGEPAAVAVTTQVCEMSLDIDADLLITEECPITSLIQRMGRCRRGRDELAKKGPGDVLIYKPDDERVYSKTDLEGLDGFVQFLQSKPAVSQADLEAGLDQFGPKGADVPKLNSFLASDAYALAGEDSLRDIEAFNVPCVLQCDIPAYTTAASAMKPGYVVPVPKKLKPQPDTRLPNWLFAADDRHYDPNTGFHDEPIR